MGHHQKEKLKQIIDDVGVEEFIELMKILGYELKEKAIAPQIRWEQRYSTTSEDDKFGRWMRIGRVNGMTLAIITKVKGEFLTKFVIALPNINGNESIHGHLIRQTEEGAINDAERHIIDYIHRLTVDPTNEGRFIDEQTIEEL